jgi:hypothetical protein
VGLVGFQLLEQMPSIIVALDAHLDSALQRYMSLQIMVFLVNSSCVSFQHFCLIRSSHMWC